MLCFTSSFLYIYLGAKKKKKKRKGKTSPPPKRHNDVIILKNSLEILPNSLSRANNICCVSNTYRTLYAKCPSSPREGAGLRGLLFDEHMQN